MEDTELLIGAYRSEDDAKAAIQRLRIDLGSENTLSCATTHSSHDSAPKNRCLLPLATSVKVGQGFRLALPTGAYYTGKGSVLEGTPIEPDELVEFDWRERRLGQDRQLDFVIESLRKMTSVRAS